MGFDVVQLDKLARKKMAKQTTCLAVFIILFWCKGFVFAQNVTYQDRVLDTEDSILGRHNIDILTDFEMDKTSEDSFEWADVYEDDDIDHDDGVGMDDFEEMGRMSKQNNAAVSDGQVNIAVTDGESVTTTTSEPTTISTTTNAQTT